LLHVCCNRPRSCQKEEDRQQALALLNETEQILQRRADWKQRLRLKYKECLWV
jgi:hypothetical protein